MTFSTLAYTTRTPPTDRGLRDALGRPANSSLEWRNLKRGSQGIGSGSTSFLALLALSDRVKKEGLNILCVPTSLEIESYCTALGLTITTLVNARPDWCFDGADEVDPDNNLIKGRGGAFVREQLVFAAAPQRVILVDESKFVPQLGTSFGVPLAVVPEASAHPRYQRDWAFRRLRLRNHQVGPTAKNSPKQGARGQPNFV